jgi:hypothetical protein
MRFRVVLVVAVMFLVYILVSPPSPPESLAMPVYLDEDQMGSDAAVVGFPHLLLCMGVVCVTNNTLYGIHFTEVDKTNELADTFSAWLGNQGVAPTDIHSLYGSANLTVRYTHGGVAGPNSNYQALWKVEMARIARKLGYRGPVYGFDASVIVPKNGFYAEFQARYTNHTCRIYYKRDEKMQYTKASVPTNATQVKPSYTIPDKQYKDGRYAPAIHHDTQLVPIANPTTSATRTNHGALTEVDYALRLIQFIHV